MPQYCCVPQCTNARGGHVFPRNPAIRQKWVVAIKRLDPRTKRLWEPKSLDRVCSDHFTNEDYHPPSCLGERKRLRAEAVPSIFSFNAGRETSSSIRRRQRMKRKADTITPEISMVPDVGNEVVITEEVVLDEQENSDTIIEQQNVSNVEVECNILTQLDCRYSLIHYIDNPKAIQYLTGFDNYDHVMMIFNVLGKASFHLTFKCSILEPHDQLFLTLIKLRQAWDDYLLSMNFKISESTVSKIVTTWINFMYFQFKRISIWPPKDIVQAYMPINFKKQFANTRVILDATEVPVAKPTNVCAQSSTFSSYKHRNTLKTMIGCTPRGLISFIGDSYGGSTSDRQLIERSDLLKDGIFEPKDSIMADRGILVQDLFATKDVQVNTPTMLKGKTQLEAVEVVRDRRIASKRIHIERVIGLTKTFKILKREMPHSKRILGSRIIFVCFMLSNFRRSVVNKLA